MLPVPQSTPIPQRSSLANKRPSIGGRPDIKSASTAVVDKKAAEEERLNEIFVRNFQIVAALLPTAPQKCKIWFHLVSHNELPILLTFLPLVLRCRKHPQMGYKVVWPTGSQENQKFVPWSVAISTAVHDNHWTIHSCTGENARGTDKNDECMWVLVSILNWISKKENAVRYY